MSTLFLCAAGNPEGVRLAIEVNEAAARWDRIVLLDDDPAKQGQEILGVPVIGGFAALADHQPGDQAVNLVARSTKGRDGARAKIESFGLPLVSLIHPSVDQRWCEIGDAVTIYAGSVLSALSTVGDHSVIFTQAVLGHGASLGRGAVLAPGAVINARVKVGDRAYVGSNASVLPDLEIGEDATVSACSAAVSNVPPQSTALGIPAEIMGAAPAAVAATGADAAATLNGGDAAALSDLQAAFAKVLGQESVGSDSNFFDAGGTSKAAVALQAGLQQIGITVGIVDIFRFPSPALLARHLFGDPAPATGFGQDNAFGHEATARPSRAEMRRRRRPTVS